MRIGAEIEALAAKFSRARRRLSRSDHPASERRTCEGTRRRPDAAAEGPAWTPLRRAAVLSARCDHRPAVRGGDAPSLQEPGAVRLRAHGDRRHRRLRPRADGAGIRHRPAVPAALQADRLGRVGRRSHSLLPLGHGAEGRPRHALDRRVDPPGARRHDHPHRGAGDPLSWSATARSTTSWSRASTSRWCRARPPSSSPQNSPSARSGTAAPASRATWSSRTSRTARAACATCTRCSGSRNTSTACARPASWSSAACSTRRSTAPSAAARISSGRSAATCTSSPSARRSGCRSTSSARWRCGSATPAIPACRTSSAS